MQTHFYCFHIPAVIFQQFPHICTKFYTHLCWNDSIRHQWVIMVPLAKFVAKVLMQMPCGITVFIGLRKVLQANLAQLCCSKNLLQSGSETLILSSCLLAGF